MNNRPLCFLLLFLAFAGSINLGLAQLQRSHLDVGAHFTQWNFQHLEGAQPERPGLAMRVGLSVVSFPDKGLYCMVELGAISRRMTRNIAAYEFKYRFFTIQSPVMLRWEITDRWHLEASIVMMMYTSRLLKEHGSNDPARIRLGDGFGSFDLAPMVGLLYHLSPRIALAGRIYTGMMPMMNYLKVGPMGELITNQRDMRATTAELFFRFHMLP